MAGKRGRPAKNSKPVKEFPVSYGNVSFGDRTASVGLSISRGNCTVNEADKAFTGKRLTMTMFAGPPGSGGTPSAFADGDLEVTAVFDSTGFSAKSKKIGLTVSAMLEDIDPATFSQFAKRDGRIEIASIEDADGDGGEEGDE